ncbi:MAG: hypothetical protein SPI92_00710, partial [Alloprevotella sp.]|nr:hypothetical protein [Alloprevotella sp.]
GTTVWAREITVSVRENPVTLTVWPQTHSLRRGGEGRFRGNVTEFSKQLTKDRLADLKYATNCQNQRRHGGDNSGRGRRR